jgi:hypothetical protein
VRLYVGCWLLVVVLALGAGAALAAAVARQEWSYVALDVFYLAEAAALAVYLWRHPPIGRPPGQDRPAGESVGA